MRERSEAIREAARASFGLPSVVAMALAIVAGLFLPAVKLGFLPRTFGFTDFGSTRSLLEVIATVTISVVGLAFSVTLVAFTLASQQLSPRVLRSFRRDRLTRLTLACFLGTFAYTITVLVRLDPAGRVSQLAALVAVLLVLVAFVLFTQFIGHVVQMLQPSAVIAGLVRDGKALAEGHYPAGVGAEPDPERVAAAEARIAGEQPMRVIALDDGYLTVVRARSLVAVAAERGALIVQRVAAGRYVLPGTVLAEVWCTEEDAEALADAVRGAFELGAQRTLVQDVSLPVRQLADIALKGLSPSVNDPTTTENAIDGMAAVLLHFARAEQPARWRAGSDGEPRLRAEAPRLDELLRLGFEQVRLQAADGYPVVSAHLEQARRRIERSTPWLPTPPASRDGARPDPSPRGDAGSTASR